MEERQVTVDGETIPLPRPFFVIATQNPIELEGTFPLPEAQLDRFLLKVHLDYPEREEEMAILQRFQTNDPLDELEAVANPEQIIRLQRARAGVRVSTPIRAYVTDIVRSTRDHPLLWIGASPRATLGLLRASQALAALHGREYVLPDDVKTLAKPVLSHRLILTERERIRGEGAEGVLQEIMEKVPVPPKIDA
jgi:MoxR-like ATPase